MNISIKNLYALAIIAHPDDESFLLAGTSLKFAEEGKSVGVICVTRGEKGADRLNRNLTEEQMAEIRSQELQKACNILKCQCTEFGNHPDGRLDQTNFDELVGELVQKINQYQPKIILTFGKEGISGHKDHIVIGKAAVAAAQKSNPKPKEVWLASMPVSAIDDFNAHLTTRKVHHSHFNEHLLKGVPDDQLLKIDISKYAEQKHQALKAHESQYMPSFVLDILQNYECFEVIEIKKG
jgi:LmbE family N-acetylglucosaminyl deacetylase